MAIAFRNRAHNESDSADTIVVTKPGGVVDGDLLIAILTQDTNGGTLSCDTGIWIEFAATGGALTSMESRAFYRKADSEPSSWSFGTTSSDNDFGVIVGVFFNDAGLGDWTLEDEQFDRVASGNTLTTTTITGVDDGLYVCGFANDDNEDVSTPPSGPVLVHEVGGAGAEGGTIASIAHALYYEFVSSGSISDAITWGGGAEELSAHCAIFSWLADSITVTGVGDDSEPDTRLSVVVAGQQFEADQNGGTVHVTDNAVWEAGADEVEVEVTAWDDTSITINLLTETGSNPVLDTLSAGEVWCYVTNDSAERSPGFSFILKEPGATWKANLNTNPPAQAVDTNFRVRVQLKNTGGDTDATPAFKWQYDLNAADTWPDLTDSSSAIRTVASSHFANGDDIIEVLLTGSEILTGNNNAALETGSDGAFAGGTAMQNDEIIETEICLTIPNAGVSDGDTIDLRLYDVDGDAVFGTYTETIRITVSEGGAAEDVDAALLMPGDHEPQIVPLVAVAY